MAKKRGQAALEFLMTYGWAILVVLVVIGALAYFGVLNPSTILPEKCTLQMGLYCQDHQIDSVNNQIHLKLQNGMGKGIIISNINITGDVLPASGCFAGIGNFVNTDPLTYPIDCDEGDCTGCEEWPGVENAPYSCNPFPGFDSVYNNNIGLRIPNGRDVDISVNCTPSGPLEWSGKAKSEIKIQWYYDDSDDTYTHTMDGELLAKIE